MSDIITFKNDSIILLGDPHSLVKLKSAIKYKLNLDNYDVVCVGDVELGFGNRDSDESELRNINEACKKRNITLYIIRGNHDFKHMWERGYKFSNVFLIKDYTTAYFLNGLRALLVGGGISLDRISRFKGFDYDDDEATVYQKTDKKHEILISHDAPDYFNHPTDTLSISKYNHWLIKDYYLIKDCTYQRNVMERIVEDIDCKYIFSGHFHSSLREEKFGIKYRCLDILELYLLDSNLILSDVLSKH